MQFTPVHNGGGCDRGLRTGGTPLARPRALDRSLTTDPARHDDAPRYAAGRTPRIPSPRHRPAHGFRRLRHDAGRDGRGAERAAPRRRRRGPRRLDRGGLRRRPADSNRMPRSGCRADRRDPRHRPRHGGGRPPRRCGRRGTRAHPHDRDPRVRRCGERGRGLRRLYADPPVGVLPRRRPGVLRRAACDRRPGRPHHRAARQPLRGAPRRGGRSLAALPVPARHGSRGDAGARQPPPPGARGVRPSIELLGAGGMLRRGLHGERDDGGGAAPRPCGRGRGRARAWRAARYGRG
jgi:hypothetical protein